MPKIKSPETFAPNQVLTASALQNHVDGSAPLPGFISEQTAIQTGVLAGTDTVLVHDISINELRKATIANVLNTGNQITTTNIVTPATRDLIVGPIDGATVTGKAFSSSNGILVNVESVAHGLVTGQTVTITASNTAYSGFYAITVVNADNFTYNLVPTTPATPAASGVCSYKREGTVLVNGNISTIENINANGSATIGGFLLVGGSFRIAGSGTIAGNLQLPGVVTHSQPPVLVNSQIKPSFDYFVQTRTQSVITIQWGGAQNLGNLYGQKIAALDITFTPQKAGNTIVLDWTIHGEAWNSESDYVFVVTRTPNSGVGAGVAVALPDAVDAQNNTWSGVSSGRNDGNDASTPQNNRIKIVDMNSLAVSCTYSVHVRAANNRTGYFHLNRSVQSAGALDYETGMSVGHAHEIYV